MKTEEIKRIVNESKLDDFVEIVNNLWFSFILSWLFYDFKYLCSLKSLNLKNVVEWKLMDFLQFNLKCIKIALCSVKQCKVT